MIGDKFRPKSKKKKSIVQIIEFSMFLDELGPTSVWCYPDSLNENDKKNIALKSIQLLMGEMVYQFSYEVENIKHFGILPFPDINMIGLIYFFLIPDKNSRGKAIAATITVLVANKNDQFLYENIKILRVLIDKASQGFHENLSDNEIKRIMENLKDELMQFNSTEEIPRKSMKNLKVVFVGLDNSGKTSFLKSVENRYSELMDVTPTKGIKRSKKKIDYLGSILHEWDFGDQMDYRINYLNKAELYLRDIDLLFFIIDSQFPRMEESKIFLSVLLKTFDSFKEYPPVVISFHKFDPDIANKKEMLKRIEILKKEITKTNQKWNISYFTTSIFDYRTILSAFSYGLLLMSPNRELFRKQLRWITKEMGGISSYLLNKNALILGDYSDNNECNQFLKINCGNFHNIYMKLEEFGLILSSDYLFWELGDLQILLKKLIIEEKEFYLLLQFENENNSIQTNKFEEYLADFKEKISPLIKNYL